MSTIIQTTINGNIQPIKVFSNGSTWDVTVGNFDDNNVLVEIRTLSGLDFINNAAASQVRLQAFCDNWAATLNTLAASNQQQAMVAMAISSDYGVYGAG